MPSPRPRPGILEITPYVGGKAGGAGSQPVAKLSSNESPLGPSPKAVAAYRELAGELHRYPDGNCARAAPGDRPPPQSRSRGDRLRRRLGRADRAPGPRLCRARRRGALQPARLPDVPAGRLGRRRASGGRAGAVAHRRRRRAARARHLAHPAGVPGQPQQPDRQLPARCGAAAAARRPAGGRDPGDRRRLRRVRERAGLRQRAGAGAGPRPTP